jgi:hypothetical protein
MTLLELITHLRADFLDDLGGGQWLTDDVQCLFSNESLVRYLNEAEREYCRRRPIQETALELPVVADEPVVALPAYIRMVHAAYIQGATHDLKKRSARDLDVEKPDWKSLESGEPEFYLEQVHPPTLRLVPTPIAGGTLLLDVDRLPTAEMLWAAAATQEPQIDSEGHYALCWWAKFLALSKPDAETINADAAARAAAEFELLVGPRLPQRTHDAMRSASGRGLRTVAYYR